MKLKLGTSEEDAVKSRKKAYLDAWPIEAQLEALLDAAAGDSTKLNKLLAHIAAVKTKIKKPKA